MTTSAEKALLWCSLAQMARQLGISEAQARRMTDTGTLTIRKFPGLKTQVLLSDIERLEQESVHQGKPSDPQSKPSDRRPGRKPAHSIEETAAWVKTYLETHGTTPSKTILADGSQAGFTRNFLYDSKDIAGVQTRKNGYSHKGPWLWSLDAATTPPTNGHANTDSVF